ncbi:MAG: autotransporter outer membrane beta-barrel domain-containing protein [Thermodesulfobacteriota bacterium]|nr:autotransporter outer membrane beta-barrel domain-containing protein [Thermodesulfobacteriota bacterium]
METGIKKRVKILTIWILIGGAFLFPWQTACAGETTPLVERHTFAIGVDVSHFDNEEPNVRPGIDVEHEGSMYGVVGEYAYHNEIMMSASLDYSTGDPDYDGYTQFGVPMKADVDAVVVECRGLIGYDYVLGRNHVVTPFVGVGYRYWENDLKGDRGLTKEVEYWYSPVGIKTYSPLSGKWTWGASLEYDVFWDGEADTDVSGMPTFHFDSGYGARLSLRFGRELTANVALFFEPYITYWDIDESDVELYAIPAGTGPNQYMVLGSIEPDNETATYGLRVRLEF